MISCFDLILSDSAIVLWNVTGTPFHEACAGDARRLSQYRVSFADARRDVRCRREYRRERRTSQSRNT